MRLGKTVKRLEAVAAAEAAELECTYVLCYSGDETRVQAAAGDLVAMDVFMVDHSRIKTVERVTLDPCDLGFVYDAEGVEVGRVVEVDPPYFSYCLQEGCGVVLGVGGERED